ncbi:hypothetical protein CBM2626_U30020 [Cupriavidus taiwanensis]|nr:hypothetical protein CBM2626_U30020 [Cupriavidus taiwanensis]
MGGRLEVTQQAMDMAVASASWPKPRYLI